MFVVFFIKFIYFCLSRKLYQRSKMIIRQASKATFWYSSHFQCNLYYYLFRLYLLSSSPLSFLQEELSLTRDLALGPGPWPAFCLFSRTCRVMYCFHIEHCLMFIHQTLIEASRRLFSILSLCQCWVQSVQGPWETIHSNARMLDPQSAWKNQTFPRSHLALESLVLEVHILEEVHLLMKRFRHLKI